MKATVETVDSVTKKLTIIIPRDRVQKELNKAYRNLQRDVHMRGFRPGRVPLNVLEARFKTQVDGEVTTKLVSDTLESVIEEHKLFVVSQPSIDPPALSKNQDFEYVATVEVRPEVDATGYEGLELTRELVKLEDSMVDEQLAHLQEQRSNLVEVEEERPVADGDVARIDYVMELDGKVLDNKGEPRSAHVPIRADSDPFLPGFAENVRGMSVGETRNFELQIPKDFNQPSLAGKSAKMTVTLRDIKRQEMPELDDDFAKDLDFDTMEALRTKVASDITTQLAAAADGALRRQVGEKLVALNPTELPPGLVNQQVDVLAREQYRQQGRPQPKGKIPLTETERETLATEARYRLQLSLILDSLAKKEALEVSEDDVQARLEKIAADTNQHVEAVRGYYMKNNAIDDLKGSILEEKTMAFVIEKATVTEIEKSLEEQKSE